MTTDFPWFPCYPDDFHGSRKTKTMDATQVGIYWLLLMDSWRNGPLPDDDVELAMIGRESCGKVRAVLQKCFTLGKNGWTNKRLEAIRAEQEEKRDKRVSAGRRGGYAKAKGKKSSNARILPEQCSSKALAKGWQSEPEPEPEVSKTESEASSLDCGKVGKAPSEWDEFAGWFRTHGHGLLWQGPTPPAWAKDWSIARDLSVVAKLQAKGVLLEDVRAVIERNKSPTCMLHFYQAGRWDHWHRAKADLDASRKIDLQRVGIDIRPPSAQKTKNCAMATA